MSRVLVALSVCTLLGGAGALVLSTYVINFPMLYRGACKEKICFTSYYCTALCLKYIVKLLPPSFPVPSG